MSEIEESQEVRRYRSTSVEETVAFGRWLGARLAVGAVVELWGTLGAGKTHLVRGLASGLGIESGVRSPTFTICQIYDGPVPVHHIDAYRIEDPEELLLQGFDEMRDRGIVAVEWAERVAEVLPPARLKIELHWLSENEREIEVRGFGAEFTALVANLPADLPGSSPVA